VIKIFKRSHGVSDRDFLHDKALITVNILENIEDFSENRISIREDLAFGEEIRRNSLFGFFSSTFSRFNFSWLETKPHTFRRKNYRFPLVTGCNGRAYCKTLPYMTDCAVLFAHF